MKRQVIESVQAPKAIGPYSQAVAVEAQRLVFLSGQIPLDPGTMELVGAGDIAAQTRQVMGNLEAVLSAAGLDFGHVVKTTIFLADLADFAAVNEVYGSYFSERPPARATVQVAALPKGAGVEIECVAAS